jgi:hypothetical protein
MSPKEIKSLIKTLRAAGCNYYKNGDLELHLGPVPQKQKEKSLPSVKSAPLENSTVDQSPEIPHVVQEMTSLMKMSDSDLVERLFPIPVLPEEI